MPGNIVITPPNQVMPLGPMSAFTEEIERPARVDEGYAYGETTRLALTTQARRVFRLTRSLSAADAAALENFLLLTMTGRAFWFYNLRETVPTGSYDPTGANPVGRYAVTWEGSLTQAVAPGVRTVVAQYALREVAF